MKNNETITQLYSLRAGLSLIARENDKLKQELSNAEEKKTLKITQARNETAERIEQDSYSVSLAERQSDAKEKQILSETDRQVEKINAEISERADRIVQSQSQAANDAEQDIANRKPSEDRDKYADARKKYAKNKKTILKDTSDCAMEVAGGVLGVLFCLLHLLIALYEGWSATTLSHVNVWLFVGGLFVALAIMITELVMAHRDDAGGILILLYVAYILNLWALIAACIVVPVTFNGRNPESKLDLMWFMAVFVGLTTIASFVATLLRTIRYLKECPCSASILADKRRAKAENRRLKKALKRADELDKEWAVYDALAAKVRSEASTQSGASERAKSLQYESKQLRQRTGELQRESDEKINELKKQVAKRKRAHEEFKLEEESKCEAQCKEIEKQYGEACAALTKIHSEIGVGIWKNLVDNYGSLLDPRDWKILDLIIWQLETGRADTIKEALQLADRETQTERLETAITSASQSIAYQIGTGFGSLQAQLNNNFARLANGIASTASLISWKLENMSQAMDSNSRRLSQSIELNAESIAALSEMQSENLLSTSRTMEEIASQSSLQSALLEKANSSSRDLIAAVEKLRKQHSI